MAQNEQSPKQPRWVVIENRTGSSAGTGSLYDGCCRRAYGSSYTRSSSAGRNGGGGGSWTTTVFGWGCATGRAVHGSCSAASRAWAAANAAGSATTSPKDGSSTIPSRSMARHSFGAHFHMVPRMSRSARTSSPASSRSAIATTCRSPGP